MLSSEPLCAPTSSDSVAPAVSPSLSVISDQEPAFISPESTRLRSALQDQSAPMRMELMSSIYGKHAQNIIEHRAYS